MKPGTQRFLHILLALALLFSAQIACGTSDTSETSEAPVDEPTAAAAKPTAKPTKKPTKTPLPPTEPPAPSGEAVSWLVMLYEDADDEVLEEDMVFDMNEAELVGSTDQVTIVAQMDRFKGGFKGDDNWTSTKRFLITQDNDLSAIHSEELDDLGELDMGDKQTLVDFANWAIETYPAEHYVLILSDHGAGWDGGWTDDKPKKGSSMSMQDIDNALGQILADTGIDAFEMVGFDACLMGQLEVMSAIAPHARYAIGSEETEPALGWAYAKFLAALAAKPEMSGAELGKAIVSSYIKQDTRITDEKARKILMGEGYTAKSAAAEFSADVTLSAIDLAVMQDLNAALNDLAVALTKIPQKTVSRARSYAQSYSSIWWEGIPPSYIDLGHFVDLVLDGSDDAAVKKAGQRVQTLLKKAVIAEMHGPQKPGSTGLTFYFPNSKLYKLTSDPEEGQNQYTSFVARFATASLWDDYLTFHYTKKKFDASSADLSVLAPAQSTKTDFTKGILGSAPVAGDKVEAPGAGQLAIAPLKVSASTIGPDDLITLSTKHTGSNIAYVYYYVSYYNEADDSYLTADEGYISADETKEIAGIYYPDWGNKDSLPIKYDWEPTLYYMSDGNPDNDQFAFFEPTAYGVEEDTYTVRGTYKFIESGTEMDAEIDFVGDKMTSVWGFTGDANSSGAWREITPKPGDTFTITDEYLDFDKNPDGEFVDYVGGTMTFGDKPFTMVPYYAFAGQYALAIGVEDMDGNTSWEFTEVTVNDK